MEPYYYSRMDKLRQSAYHAMLTGLEAVRPAFAVPGLELEELGQILFQLRLDHPEIFYVTGFSCRTRPGAASVEFLPQYLFDKGKILDHRRALTARAAKLARPVQDKSEWEKERYVHDFICQNVRYDKLKKPYSHEILGPLGQGVGVCEGIAKSVKLLCGVLGVWCIVAISENAPDKGIRYRHAWNIVRIGGQYYHLDATFDNSLGGDRVVRYDYFNLDDRKIFRDHEPLITPAPPCTQGDRFFYREEKLSFTKTEEAGRRALQAIRKKRPLVFHWRGGYLTRQVLEELADALEGAAREKGLHAQIRVNCPQAVLQASFVPEQPRQALTAQQANEGEDLPPPEGPGEEKSEKF